MLNQAVLHSSMHPFDPSRHLKMFKVEGVIYTSLFYDLHSTSGMVNAEQLSSFLVKLWPKDSATQLMRAS